MTCRNGNKPFSFSIMETNSQGPSRDEAAQALKELSADRDRLAAGIRAPWLLLAGFGAVAAWWVSAAAATSPGEDYDSPAISGLVLAIVLVIIHLIRRETGVRFKSMGLQAGLALAGIVAGCLALFSISLGLVSFGLHWAVALTSITAFALTTWLASVAYRSAAQNLRHG
jgi:predicted branched-subunit amino acid permease